MRSSFLLRLLGLLLLISSLFSIGLGWLHSTSAVSQLIKHRYWDWWAVRSFHSPSFALSGRLFIWGARITQQHDHDDRTFLDVFVLCSHQTRGKVRFNLSSEFSELLDDQELHTNLTVAMLYPVSAKCHTQFPLNEDSNSAKAHRAVRCPWIHPHQASSGVTRFSVLFKWQSIVEQVDFLIDGHHGSVGLAGPLNEPHFPPFVEHPGNRFTLCVGGVDMVGIPYLAEFLQYHLRIGIDRIVLGVHGARGNASVLSEVEAIRKQFQPLLGNGALNLFPLPLTNIEFVQRDTLKLLFYHACLFHAKTITSKYVGVWDLDEYVVQSPTIDQSLPDMLDQFESPAKYCSDWCYVNLPAHLIWQETEHRVKRKDIKTVAKVFTIRQAQTKVDYVWKKSIARTKNVFHVGFHTFGSCLKNGTLDLFSAYIAPKHGNQVRHNCVVNIGPLATMHHYLGLFYGGHENAKVFVPPFVDDEYATFINEHGHTVSVSNWNTGYSFLFNRVPTDHEPNLP